MDNSSAISFDDAEFQLLFEEAGLTDTPPANMDRVEKVIERSLHEKAIKDTASFVFLGFPAAIVGLLEISTNTVRNNDIDYRA